MGRRRKTFSIAGLLYLVNTRNRNSTCDPKVREGWNCVLESVLMEANVYDGFNYLEQKDIPWAEKPGIRFVRLHTGYADFDVRGKTVIDASEFYSCLDAENQNRETNGKTAAHSPTGMTREFPDESRRTYYIHKSLMYEYRAIEERETRKALKEHRATVSG